MKINKNNYYYNNNKKISKNKINKVNNYNNTHIRSHLRVFNLFQK